MINKHFLTTRPVSWCVASPHFQQPFLLSVCGTSTLIFIEHLLSQFNTHEFENHVNSLVKNCNFRIKQDFYSIILLIHLEIATFNIRVKQDI